MIFFGKRWPTYHFRPYRSGRTPGATGKYGAALLCVATLASIHIPVAAKVLAGANASVPFQSKDGSTITVTPLPLGQSVPLTDPGRGLYRWFDAEVAPVPASALDEYRRYTWRQVETGQGKYDFSLIEAEAVAAQRKGHKFSFRIMPVWSGKGVCVPDYLAAMMPRSYTSYSEDGTTPVTYVPDWNSAAYLSRAASLVSALARKYDGDPRIGYVDIGLYGNWGEWNQGYGFTPQLANLPAATSATKHALVDMHINAFRRTQLLMMTDDADAVTYAMQRSPKIGLRRDSLAEPWFAKGLTGQGAAAWNATKDRWKTSPCIAEIVGSSTPSEDFVLGVQQVRSYHISAIANGNFCAATSFGSLSQVQQNAFVAMGVASGYRFRLSQITFPAAVGADGALQVQSSWINTGCTPAYLPWNITYALRTASGTTVWSGVSALDLRKLLPGVSNSVMADSFTIGSNVATGSYLLVMTVVDAAAYYPAMALAIQGQQSDGGYCIGTINVNQDLQ